MGNFALALTSTRYAIIAPCRIVQRAKVPAPVNLTENDFAIMRALHDYGSLSNKHLCIETGCFRDGVFRSYSEISDSFRTTGHSFKAHWLTKERSCGSRRGEPVRV